MSQRQNRRQGAVRALFFSQWLVTLCWIVFSHAVHAAPDNAANERQFFVSGTIGSWVENLMFVRHRPAHRAVGKYPVVMIHGAAQTGAVWLGTPDGRSGWADYFVEHGHDVYVVDQPGSGQSAYHPSYGALARLSAAQVERIFSSPARFQAWPQAARHTQFPGEGSNRGLRGEPVFERFYANQVPFVGRAALGERLMREAGAALLDRIGPAILVTHSQSGPYGWVIAEARPMLVKAIVAIEPTGPPLRNAVFGTAPARPWGITETPLAYDPPITDPKQLKVVEQPAPDGPNLVACMQQGQPAHQLTNLRNIPVMVFVAEASYHAVYDHCTAKWLSQAGVKTDFVRLEDAGLRGNGHMVMIEKNSLEIAALVQRWIESNVR
jgi:pimeloyl-ACP methyl ester carboxylesterase